MWPFCANVRVNFACRQLSRVSEVEEAARREALASKRRLTELSDKALQAGALPCLLGVYGWVYWWHRAPDKA